MFTQQTADDLRVAAHVIEVAGHIKGGEVTTQGVCALGAIGIATQVYGLQMYPSHVSDTGYYIGRRLFGSLCDLTGQYYRAPLRAQSAIDALVEVIPRTGQLESLASEYDDPSAYVHIWNDRFCDGGDDAISLFTTAAEKVEANLP